MKAVQEEGMTVSGAAKQFQVPRKTLDDRIKGRVEHGSRPGPPTALSAEEEGALAAYLLYMAKHGFPTWQWVLPGQFLFALGHKRDLTQKRDRESTGGEAFAPVIQNLSSAPQTTSSAVERMRLPERWWTNTSSA